MTKSFRNYSDFLKSVGLMLLCCISILSVAEISLRLLGHLQQRRPFGGKIFQAGEYIIVCIGDSFTYGLGVEGKDAYPAQLERLLNQRLTGRRFRVFNFGVPGTNSSMHLKYFSDLVHSQAKPDMVIVMSGANDSWNLAQSNLERIVWTQNYLNILKIRFSTFISEFRIYKMVKLIAINIRNKSPESGIAKGGIVFATKDMSTEILSRLKDYNLSQMAILAKTNGIRLILQNYPSSSCGDGFDTPEGKIAARFSLPFVNNCAPFTERLKSSSLHDLYIYDNSHPNAYGYSIMAEEIYKVVKKIYQQ